MAALAGSQIPGGAAAAAAIRPPPLGIPLSRAKGAAHVAGTAAGKMAAASAPYAKYPPPPPLRPPGGKGKRVGFTPPPPPAQTPSSLSVRDSRSASPRPRSQRPPDGSHRDRTSSGLTRPTSQHSVSSPDRPGATAICPPPSGAAGRACGTAGCRCAATDGALVPPPPQHPSLPPLAEMFPDGIPVLPPSAPPRRRGPDGRLHLRKKKNQNKTRFLPQELAPSVPRWCPWAGPGRAGVVGGAQRRPKPRHEGRRQRDLNGVRGGVEGVELYYWEGGVRVWEGGGERFCVICQGPVKGQSSWPRLPPPPPESVPALPLPGTTPAAAPSILSRGGAEDGDGEGRGYLSRFERSRQRSDKQSCAAACSVVVGRAGRARARHGAWRVALVSERVEGCGARGVPVRCSEVVTQTGLVL